jgi:3-oxoacyl-[acyl-carrier-protein] synthase III
MTSIIIFKSTEIRLLLHTNCFNEAWEKGKIKSGDTVVLAAFGSGFTWEALS